MFLHLGGPSQTRAVQCKGINPLALPGWVDPPKLPPNEDASPLKLPQFGGLRPPI